MQAIRPTLDEVTAALIHLLPKGPVWPSVEGPASTMGDLMAALAEEPTRIFAAGADATQEAWPGTAVWTIDEWEALLGLEAGTLTLAQRQAQAAAFLVSQRGSSRPALIALMQALGYPDATITQGFLPAMMGVGVGWPVGTAGDKPRFTALYHYWQEYSIFLPTYDNAVVDPLDVPPPYEEVGGVAGRKVTTSAPPAVEPYHLTMLGSFGDGVLGGRARAAVFMRNEEHAVTMNVAGTSETLVVPVGLGWKRVDWEIDELDVSTDLGLRFLHAGNGVFSLFGSWVMAVDPVLEALVLATAQAHTYSIFRNAGDVYY